MDQVFSNYRLNKHIDRNGVNKLMTHMRTKNTTNSVIVFSTADLEQNNIQENWYLEKNKAGKNAYSCFDK